MEAFQVTKYPNVISCGLHGSWEPLLLLVLSGL
jgi:hypothetical protein